MEFRESAFEDRSDAVKDFAGLPEVAFGRVFDIAAGRNEGILVAGNEAEAQTPGQLIRAPSFPTGFVIFDDI